MTVGMATSITSGTRRTCILEKRMETKGPGITVVGSGRIGSLRARLSAKDQLLEGRLGQKLIITIEAIPP
jgi:hypothetical protein